MPKKVKKPSRTQLREQAREKALNVSLPARCDVTVIGGGPAGLVAAICAAESGSSVAILERNLSCGSSILVTGNGRCNFSNTQLSWDHYNDPDFVAAVCGPHFAQDVQDFFADCGLSWIREENRLYPYSQQAASVRDVLIQRALQANVTLGAARTVETICPPSSHTGDWCLTWCDASGRQDKIYSSAVVFACGGTSLLVDSIGLATAPQSPVLCPLACTPIADISLEALDGRRAKADVLLFHKGQRIAAEQGEVLFRNYGLSGIVIFNFSRLAQPHDTIVLDLTCNMSPDQAQELIEHAQSTAGILDPKIACALADTPSEQLKQAQNFAFTVKGPAHAEQAQVHRGGLLTTQFDAATLESSKLPGFFAAGEALDIDGACGGFNLSWAWKSGIVAGFGAATYAKQRNF